MIKSKYFWIAAILFAIIPLLIIDISQHSIDWRQEVRGEIISVVQDSYTFNKQQKAEILDKVFERNQSLIFFIYFKGFACLILFGFSLYFFKLYQKQKTPGVWKSVLTLVFVIVSFLSVKVFLINELNGNHRIKFLSFPPGEYSFRKIYDQHFKGKVVYVDFWGTTCGPCLEEFRNFTKPLKEHYKLSKDLAYLYISQGNKYLWKQQIKKYDIEGYHIFLQEDQYEKLFQEAAGNNLEPVLMPRYLIIDKEGKIVISHAKQPSDTDSLYVQLDKYITANTE